jgi:hypothetical protein
MGRLPARRRREQIRNHDMVCSNAHRCVPARSADTIRVKALTEVPSLAVRFNRLKDNVLRGKVRQPLTKLLLPP